MTANETPVRAGAVTPGEPQLLRETAHDEESCPFCGYDPSKVLYRHDGWYVIRTTDPKAEVHLLAVSEVHRERFDNLVPPMFMSLRFVLRELQWKGLLPEDYRVVVNVGEGGKQKVKHAHVHLLGGEGATTDGIARTL